MANLKRGFNKSPRLAFRRALEKKANRASLNPSVCMQQPCTSVRITRLTRTRLMDLDEALKNSQYKFKRSEGHKLKRKRFSKPIGQSLYYSIRHQ